MKIAILLFGEYREFESSIKTFSLFDKYSPEYYVSTWNTSDDGFVKQNVNESKIKNFLPQANVSISENLETPDNEQKLHYHWRTLIKKLEESNKKYDVVILSRIDYYIENLKHEIFETIIEENIIFVPSGKGFNIEYNAPIIDDNFFVGTQTSICKFINELPYETMPSHVGIAKSMINSKIQIEETDLFFNTFIIRSNMKDYLNDDGFFDEMYYKMYDDFQNQRNNLV